LPSPDGGANWRGAAFDPETAILYVPSSTWLTNFRVIKPDPNRSNLRYMSDWTFDNPRFIRGLPIVKPPAARVTAIDLNTGEHVWMSPVGEGPMDHPELEGLDIPPIGAKGTGHGPLLTKSLLFVAQGWSRHGSDADKQSKLLVYDKETGAFLGRVRLPANPYGNPMTYMHEGRQYIAVTCGGGTFLGARTNEPAQVVALCLYDLPD
jgi:quinoprotein glucose dehydrogenase